jgi:hypothetical protein
MQLPVNESGKNERQRYHTPLANETPDHLTFIPQHFSERFPHYSSD